MRLLRRYAPRNNPVYDFLRNRHVLNIIQLCDNVKNQAKRITAITTYRPPVYYVCSIYHTL